MIDWRDVRDRGMRVLRLRSVDGEELAGVLAGRSEIDGRLLWYACPWAMFELGGDLSCGSRYYPEDDLSEIDCPFMVGQRVYLIGANPLHIAATVTETMGDHVFVYWGDDRLTIVKEPCARLSAEPTPGNPT